jgi:hypothetical protein
MIHLGQAALRFQECGVLHPAQEVILVDAVGAGPRGFHVAELLVHLRVDVAGVFGEELRRAGCQRGLHVQDGRQLLEVKVDRRCGLQSGQRILGRDRGEFLADVPHAVHGEDRLVVARRADTEADLSGLGRRHDVDHPGHAPRAGGVDPAQQTVRHRALQERQVQHAGTSEVVDVAGTAGRLVGRVHPLGTGAQDAMPGHRPSPGPSPIVAAAACTASTIFW